MAQRVHAQAAVIPSISKVCEVQREFEASVRALNDFFVRKKRDSTGLLLTPTRTLHEKGLIADYISTVPALSSQRARSSAFALHPHFKDFLKRTTYAAIARVCVPSLPLSLTAATDIINESRAALISACNSGLKVLNEDVVLPVIDAIKRDLVKGGKCPSSEFVPERERERLRSETAAKVMEALSELCASVPRSASDSITEIISTHFLASISLGAALHTQICTAISDTALNLAEQEVKMIILFTCNEANSQIVVEKEAIKDALNCCVRPETSARLESYKAEASLHLSSSIALRRRVDCLRDAFKPAIKRLREGCDITRRVEESMVTSATLGHAAILEEQTNLIQLERLHAHTRSEMVTLHCLVGGGGTVKVKMPPMRLLDLFSNKELIEVACSTKLRASSAANELSLLESDSSKARKLHLEKACEREYAALRLPHSCPSKLWEEKNIQRVSDSVLLRKAGSIVLAHTIAHTSIRPTHPTKKIGSPKLVSMPPPSGPPSPRLGSSNLPTGMPPPLMPKV